MFAEVSARNFHELKAVGLRLCVTTWITAEKRWNSKFWRKILIRDSIRWLIEVLINTVRREAHFKTTKKFRAKTLYFGIAPLDAHDSPDHDTVRILADHSLWQLTDFDCQRSAEKAPRDRDGCFL